MFLAAINSDVTRILDPYIHDLLIVSMSLSSLAVAIGGYLYMTSSGNIGRIEKAKKVIRNSLIGLVIVLSANFLTNFLNQQTSTSFPNSNNVPKLEIIAPKKTDSGLVDVIIKAITGVFANVINSITEPIVNGLNYFIKGTPLPTKNSDVFNLWLVVLAISNALFVVVLLLSGMHLMSFSFLGLNEISPSKLAGRLLFGFMLMNSSIFIIDIFVDISNSIIKLISNDSVFYVFKSIKQTIADPNFFSLGGTILLIVFLVISIILMIYYLTRIIGIYLGAILSPIIILFCLVPGIKDMMIGLIKKYFININIIFVHVLILELAGSLINNIDNNSGGIMPLLLALSTFLFLIKSPSVISQLAGISTITRYTKQIGDKVMLSGSAVGGAALSLGSSAMSLGNSALSSYRGNGSYMSPDEYAIKATVHKTAEKIRNGESNINDLKGLRK